jgi:arylformamidase
VTVVDLSHPISDGMHTHPGLPAPVIAPHLSRDGSRTRYHGLSEFQVDSIQMVGNTGTYLDSPYHRFPSGRDLSMVDIGRHVNLFGIVVRKPHGVREILPHHLPKAIKPGSAVLFRTDWDQFWGKDEYGIDAPYLHRTTAAALVEAAVAMVGIDAVNVDDLEDLSRPAHTLLLGANIGIVEHLRNLAVLEASPFRFFAVAPALRAVGTFPVRAFALVSEQPLHPKVTQG